MMNKKELELYIHIPFCVKKCRYCDFLSFSAEEEVKKAYIDALCKEIKGLSSLGDSYEITTIFIGGGTPSILEADQIAKIMKTVYRIFSIQKEAEITIEINPGTVTREKLIAYKENGINRLSIGLQSAQDKELKLLGRIHTYEDFLLNYEMARKLGFENISIDLMSALPDQSLRSYEDNLKKVLALNPEHISSYSLILEEGTPFYKDKSIHAILPTEEEEREMYDLTNRMLKAEGYYRYEISNYAKTGKEGRHNLGYWTGVSYLGVGLGASSYLAGARFSNTANLESYQNYPDLPFENREKYHILSQKESMEEFMFLGLRMIQGIKTSQFHSLFSLSIEQVYGDVIQQHIEEGLLLCQNGVLRFTEKGLDVSNYVLCDFLLD